MKRGDPVFPVAGACAESDREVGRVMQFDGDRVLVGWDSGVQTWTDRRTLVVLTIDEAEDRRR